MASASNKGQLSLFHRALIGAAGPRPRCWEETVHHLTSAHSRSAQRAAVIGLKAEHPCVGGQRINMSHRVGAAPELGLTSSDRGYGPVT